MMRAGVAALVLTLLLTGCTARQKRAAIDKRAGAIIESTQQQALGEAAEFDILPPEDALRRRLLIGQDLPFYAPASLGSDFLAQPKGTPEATEPRTVDEFRAGASLGELSGPMAISLADALQIAAANSRAYQSRKENVFRSALRLDLEREEFRTSFTGLVSTLFRHNRGATATGGPVTEQVETDAVVAATKTLKTGAQLTLRIGVDLLKLLRPGDFSTQSFFGDATVNIPLLRGAGRRIAAEALTQAERDVVYAIYDFEEYKRGFAVGIARQYLSVLQREDQVRNAEENYRSLITSSRRARRLLQAGNLPPIQVDQALQDELKARNRWISARTTLDDTLDAFKLQVGLPVDAAIVLQRADFDAIAGAAAELPAATAEDPASVVDIPAADAPVELTDSSPAKPGPLELPYERAIGLAFEHRLDLRTVEGRVGDAQRGVVLAANGFKPNLNLQLAGGTESEKLRDLNGNQGNYSARLLLDLPFERTAEGVAYRQSLIALEAAVRSLQELEDSIKLSVRGRLRDLHEARESVHIQTLSLQLARRRVRGADLNLQAGRIPIRDLLDAQEDLLSAQNALTSASVSYRLAELDLQRDLGVLRVSPGGLWQEFIPDDEPAP